MKTGAPFVKLRKTSYSMQLNTNELDRTLVRLFQTLMWGWETNRIIVEQVLLRRKWRSCAKRQPKGTEKSPQKRFKN